MNRRQRRRRVRLVRVVAAALLLAAAAAWGIGSRLSPRHAEEAIAWVPASPESVWLVLTDLDGMPAWRRDLASVERLPNGADGDVIRWREIGPGGARTALERLEAAPPARLVIRPAGATDPTRRWIYRLTPRDRGTEVVVREEREIENPMERVLVSIFGASRTRIDGLARDLEQRLAGRGGELATRLMRRD